MARSGYITRDDLSLPQLDLFTGVYDIKESGFSTGGVIRSNKIVTSPWTDYGVQVHTKKQMSVLSLMFMVQEPTVGAVKTSIETLEAALAQWGYNIAVSWGDVSYLWVCSTYRSFKINYDPRHTLGRVASVDVTLPTYNEG